MKRALKYFILCGSAYALAMMLFNTLYQHKPFNLQKFLIDFTIFGLFMSFGAIYFNRTNDENNNR